MSRFFVRISHASRIAASSRSRTSSSMIEAISSEKARCSAPEPWPKASVSVVPSLTRPTREDMP